MNYRKDSIYNDSSQEGRMSTTERATSSALKGKRSRGRPLSKVTKAAIDLVHRYPHISPKELRRLLIHRGFRVSYDYAAKLKKRSGRFLSLSGISVHKNSVHIYRGEVKRSEIHEKKPKMGLDLASREAPMSQGTTSIKEIGTQFSNGVRSMDRIPLPEASPTMFGLVLPAEVYRYVSSVWDLYDGQISGSRNIRVEKFEGMRNQRDAWYCVFYDDFRMVLTCPSKRRGGDCLLYWRIRRVFSVEKYHEGLRRVSEFLGLMGFEFRVGDVVPLIRSQYVVKGDPMLFEGPFRVTAPDGSFMIFDRSLGVSEYEFSSLEDALEYMRFRNGLNAWRSVREEVRDMKGLLKAVVNALKSKGIIPSYGNGGASG